MKVAYWIVTLLAAGFMALSGIPDILRMPEAVAFFKHLGYPEYLLPFIGVAKILGSIAIVFPKFPALKEWAYAGLVFDLVGAFYSHVSVGDPLSVAIFPVIALVLVAGSYTLYRQTSQPRS